MKYSIVHRYVALLAIGFFAFVSCNDNPKKNTRENLIGFEETAKNHANEAIVFTVDGITRTIGSTQREADTIDLGGHPVKTLFRKKGRDHEFEINLNFYERGILDKIPITYSLPQDHKDQVKIDLNFYDFQRKVEKSTNRRLVFDEGIITIHELGKDKIRFNFEGQVYELMNNKKRSSVSGSVNVDY